MKEELKIYHKVSAFYSASSTRIFATVVKKSGFGCKICDYISETTSFIATSSRRNDFGLLKLFFRIEFNASYSDVAFLAFQSHKL